MHLASRGGTGYAPTTILSLALLISLSITEPGCGGSSSTAAAPPSSTKSLTAILISPATPTVALGENQQLTATGVSSEGSRQDITKTVTWASAQPSVASINQSGLASGKQVGGAKLTATSGSVTASVTLAVGAATLVSIAVTPQSPSVPKGETQQLNAVGTFTDGSQKTVTDSATWSVFPTDVASISPTGSVKGQRVGSAKVFAEVDSIRASDPLTVLSAVLVSINVSPQSPSVPKGETQQFTAVANFSDGSQKAITDSATWSVAPTGIATVSSTGLITAQAEGSATVTAESASVHGSDLLTVSSPVLVSISVTPANSSIMLGTTEQLTATGTFDDGSTQNLTNSATWSSANSSMVSIGPAGLAAANSVGSTSISATSGARTGSAALTVEPELLVTYFSQANNPAAMDATVYLTNVGMTHSSLCAMVYVFDTQQEMTECCACSTSIDDLRTLSMNNDLTNRPATGAVSATGVIEIVPAGPSSQACNASSSPPGGELRAWSTHIQVVDTTTLALTEAPFEVVPLTPTHASQLQSQCGFLMEETQGICTCGGTGD
ncbi:MAG: Ig-like domain-containing protein [Candidatus Sulfotelmatobacter sp.]